MKSKSWLNDLINKYKDDDDYKLGKKIIDVTEQISIRLDELGISKKELAERLGKNPAFITKLLNGKNNFTLRTLFNLSKALEVDLNIQFNREQEFTFFAGVNTTYKDYLDKSVIEGKEGVVKLTSASNLVKVKRL